MTVPVQVPETAYAEDGVSTSFPIPWLYRRASHIRAQREFADGSVVELVNGSDFSATDDGASGGGTLTTMSAAGECTLRIWRETTASQETEYETTGAFTAKSHEAALDESVMRSQEVALAFERTLTAPVGERGMMLPPRNERRGFYLGFDSNGDPTALPDGGNDAALRPDLLSPDGANFVGLKRGGKVQDAIDYITPEMRGFVGDGSSGDTDKFAEAVTAAEAGSLVLSARTFAITATSSVQGGAMRGAGSSVTKLKRTGNSNLLNMFSRVGERIEGLTLDMNRTDRGNMPGHGISASGEDLVFNDVAAKDYGSDGIGGGSGILVGPSAAFPIPKRIRMTDCAFYPDPAAAISLGWIWGDVTHGIASRIYVEGAVGGIGYAHELKDNARFNSLDQLIARNSNVAVAYGQQTAGVDGCDYNMVTNWIGDGTDQGWLVGEGFGNGSLGSIHSTAGSPGNTDKRSIQFTGGAMQNFVIGHATFGAMDRTVYISGDRNFADVLAHDTGTVLGEFTPGSDKNVVRVAHPGNRTSVLGSFIDNSGYALDSANANVVRSDATGERIGSISGRFWDKLGNSNVTPLGSHNWVFEAGQYAFHALQTPGNTNDISGLVFSTGRDGVAEGRVWHVTSAARVDNYLTFAVGGLTDCMRIYRDHVRVAGAVRPVIDNTSSLGVASFRWSTIYAGTGTINTSDERLKDDISDIPEEWLDAWGAVNWQRYKFKDAIEQKGPDARWHIGLIAQRVEDAFADRGLDAFKIGLLCRDPVIETVTEYYTDTREKMETVEVTELVIEHDGERAVQREVTKTIDRPVTRLVPILDENGDPVMRRVTPAFDQNGEPVPRQDGDEEPKYAAVPVMEEFEAERQVERDTGEWRYGLRYTEAFAMEAAWVRREIGAAYQLNSSGAG